jgi:TonB family protein
MPCVPLHRRVTVLTAFGLLTQTLAAQSGSCAVDVRVESVFNTPIGDAEISLGDVRARSDSLGNARFAAVAGGATRLAVRRLGFSPFAGIVTPACSPGEKGVPQIVRLAPRAAALDPVTVRADAPVRFTGPMAGFWERRAKGDGTFFTAAEIDRRNAQRLTDLVRTVSGWGRGQQTERFANALVRGTAVRMGAAQREPERPGTQQCYPTVVIDGMVATVGELNTDGIDPRTLAGLEVYVDGARTPAEFWGTAGQGHCGVVAMWSRSLENMRHVPFSQPSVLTDSVFAAHEVDEVARIQSDQSNPVVYPKALKRKRVVGEATVGLVVLPTGEPYLRSLKLEQATHPEFGEALMDAVTTMHFAPAKRNGSAVPQRTSLTVRFEVAGEKP